MSAPSFFRIKPSKLLELLYQRYNVHNQINETFVMFLEGYIMQVEKELQNEVDQFLKD